jgi:hypothetical protein
MLPGSSAVVAGRAEWVEPVSRLFRVRISKGLFSFRRRQVNLARGMDSLNDGNIHLHRSGFPQQLNGEDEPAEVLLPDQNPFDSLERSGFDPDQVSTVNKRVRLDFDTSFDCLADALNLPGRNDGRNSGGADKPVNARGGHDIQVTLQSVLNE